LEPGHARPAAGGTIHKPTSAYCAAAAIALVAVQFSVIRFAPSATWVRLAVPATIALVPVALWPYRGRIGTWVMFVGLAANLAAILANGGLMPIERSSVAAAIGAERASRYAPGEWIPGSKDVLVEQGEGRIVALGDSLVVRAGSGRGIVASPGDVVVLAGVMLLAAEASLDWQRSRRRQHHDERPGASPREGAQGGAATPQ